MLDFAQPANGWATVISAFGGAVTIVVVYLLGRQSARSSRRWSNFADYQRRVDGLAFNLQTMPATAYGARLGRAKMQFGDLHREGGKYLDDRDRRALHRFVITCLNEMIQTAEQHPPRPDRTLQIEFPPGTKFRLEAIGDRVVVTVQNYGHSRSRAAARSQIERILRGANDWDAYVAQYAKGRDATWTAPTV